MGLAGLGSVEGLAKPGDAGVGLDVDPEHVRKFFRTEGADHQRLQQNSEPSYGTH